MGADVPSQRLRSASSGPEGRRDPSTRRPPAIHLNCQTRRLERCNDGFGITVPRGRAVQEASRSGWYIGRGGVRGRRRKSLFRCLQGNWELRTQHFSQTGRLRARLALARDLQTRGRSFYSGKLFSRTRAPPSTRHSDTSVYARSRRQRSRCAIRAWRSLWKYLKAAFLVPCSCNEACTFPPAEVSR